MCPNRNKYLNCAGYYSDLVYMTLSEYISFELSDRLRLKLALKTCIACLIAELVSYAFNFKNGYWIVFTTFLSTQLTMRMTISKGVMRIAATVIGCITGFFAVYAFQGQPHIIAVLGFFWVLIMFYIGMNGIYPFGALLAAFTPLIIVYMGDTLIDQAFTHTFLRMLDILIGVCISWAVVYFVFPVNDEEVLTENLGSLIKKNIYISINILKGNSGFDIEKEVYEFRKLVKRANNFIQNSNIGQSSVIGQDQYRLAVSLCRAMLSHMLHLHRVMSEGHSHEQNGVFAGSSFIIELSDMMEEILSTPAKDVIGYLSGHGESLARFQAHLNSEIIEPHGWLAHEEKSRELLFSRIRLLFYLVKILLELSKMSQNRMKIEVPASSVGEPSLKDGIARLKKFNGEAATGALKGALSVFLSIILWVIPFKSMQAMVPAVIVSYTGYKGQSLRRFIFLALGAGAGSAAGIAFFYMSGHVNLFMTGVISVILFVFSYVGLGEEDWSSIGVNGGITFIICIGPLAGMPEHYSLILKSTAGMIFGGLLAALIMKFVFPVNLRRMLEVSMGGLALVYIKGFDIINGIITGKTGSFDEMDETWKSLRRLTSGYIDLLRDLKWDMLFLDKRLNNPALDEDAVYYIYRNFVSVFFILKFIGSDGLNRNIEKSVDEAMNLLNMLHADWKNLLKGETISDIGTLEEKSYMLWRECEDLLEKETADRVVTIDKKGLLYQEMFLYDLSSLIRKMIDVIRLFMDRPEFIKELRSDVV